MTDEESRYRAWVDVKAEKHARRMQTVAERAEAEAAMYRYLRSYRRRQILGGAFVLFIALIVPVLLALVITGGR